MALSAGTLAAVGSAPRALPVPDLHHTLQRLHHAVTAVVDTPTAQQTQQVLEAFLTGPGPALQHDLLEYARQCTQAGQNWLAAPWLNDYLADRKPLGLSTNVAFQLRFDTPTEQSGVARVAAFLSRAVQVHLQQARGETAPEIDARGHRLSADQWACLNGGVRHPGFELDALRPARTGGEHRDIGVSLRGRMWLIPVTDDGGRQRSEASIRQALETILRVASDEATASHPAEATGGFTAVSALGSRELTAHLDQLLAHETNAHTYQQLTDMLFTLDLVDQPADEAEHLARFAFFPNQGWVRRPVSYQASVVDEWLCLNAEHSIVDGGTLMTAVERIQQANPDLAHRTEEPSAVEHTEPKELRWDYTEVDVAPVQRALAQVRDQAEDLHVRVVTVPRCENAMLPFRISLDAQAQLVMSLAQVHAYGRVRAVYESVDLREYQAGRTECLRAATPEAVEFVTALAQGTAQERQFRLALEAHRSWVKACKAGAGVDRHLRGLAHVAAQENSTAGTSTNKTTEMDAVLNNAGVRAARTDFLSTTSLGSAAQIQRYVFAPTVPEGFGISYTPHPQAFEFCVTWNHKTADQPNLFMGHLNTAGRQLSEFIAQLPSDKC